jgi:hypothetical protein
VIQGSNHHIEIVADLDAFGKETPWRGRVVSMFDAASRLRADKPVVNRSVAANQRFKFSLCRGDALILGTGADAPLWIVQKISVNQRNETQIVLKPPADARKIRDVPTAGRTHSPNTLRKSGARKVAVDALGALRDGRD